MRKVAVIGKCSSSRHHAPMSAPGWEIWCLAWDPTPVVHRLFEVHRNWRDFQGVGTENAAMHRRWLMGQVVPVYMRQVEEDIPTSVRYPLEDVHEMVGNATGKDFAYLESSIAFMFALAMLEYKQGKCHDGLKIGIWGVDLDVGTEYSYQRPNMEYLIGLARGMGIKVVLPSVSHLLRAAHDQPYGVWEPPSTIEFNEKLRAERAARQVA